MSEREESSVGACHECEGRPLADKPVMGSARLCPFCNDDREPELPEPESGGPPVSSHTDDCECYRCRVALIRGEKATPTETTPAPDSGPEQVSLARWSA